MIRIEETPWTAMVVHAKATYPNECCGAMLGETGPPRQVTQPGPYRKRRMRRWLQDHPGDYKRVRQSIRLQNAFDGAQAARYELRPEDLLKADKAARDRGMDLIGIYHSHPDCGAYFSETDLKNSCPWYSFVVLSIQKGEFDHANSWLPNAEQTEAVKEELSY